MYLIYLDESWNTGAKLDDADQPVHFISGLIIPVDEIPKIEERLRSIEVMFMPYSQNFDFEFHATDMVSGKWYFKHFKVEVRLQALKGILQVFSEQNVRFISQGVDKLKHAQKYKYPIHPHNVAFMYLVEKAETFLKNEGKKGLIIMDNNEDRAQGIINDFHSYKRNGTAYGYAKKDIVHLVDSVYYTESFNSYSMQFSDVIGYVYSSHVLAKRMGKADTLGFFKKSLFEGTDALFAAKTLYCDIEPKHVTH